MKVRLLLKTLVIQIILKLKVAMAQIKQKNISFGVFCIFVTSALCIRPSNMYIFFFQELFGFCIFLRRFLTVLEAGSQLISFDTKL